MHYLGYEINKKLVHIPYLKTSRKNENVLEKYICLDTETSHENNYTWLYQWAFAFNGGLYSGRTPRELINMLTDILTYYKTNSENKLICFVHNLQYDFSYLSYYLDKEFKQNEFLLADANHKVFQVSYENGLVLRCSYKLTNKSLKKASDDLGTVHKKLVGTVDYDIIHNQYDKLKKSDWNYQYSDCIVLDEIIKKQLEIYHDTIATMPLTSTSYVEREIKREYKRQVKKNIHILTDFQKQKPSIDAYYMQDSEFSGGYVHGNRNYIEKVIKGKIKHRDFQSMYPSEIKSSDYYPISKFIKYSDMISYRRINKKMRDNYCILVEVDFKSVSVSKDCTYPYIQFSHITNITKKSSVLLDNGRVLECDLPFSMVLDINELDLIIKQYNNPKICIKKCFIAKRGKLPDYIIKIVDENYIIKTKYKKEVERLEEIHQNKPTIENYINLCNAELTLMKAKNLLNGIYGCLAKNPIRDKITLTNGIWKTENKKNDREFVQDTLNKYYNNPNKCLHYAQGCYVTINARLRLFEMLDIVGYNNFLYCDTDSIFYLSTPEIEKAFEEWNKREYEKAMKNGYYVIVDDKKQHYREFKLEHEEIVKFKFLHSKCYMYQLDNGQYKSTIAGVRKYVEKYEKNGDKKIITAVDELKKVNKNPFRAFTEGMTFNICGGTKAQYIDHFKLGIESEFYTYNGNETQGGCIITPTTKTLKFVDVDDEFITDIRDIAEIDIK